MRQPKQLEGDAAATGGHYDRFVEAESARLEHFCPVEYAITLRYLNRFVPEHWVGREEQFDRERGSDPDFESGMGVLWRAILQMIEESESTPFSP